MAGIHHLALRVRDCEISARFYESAIGLLEMRRIQRGDELHAVWLRAGETVLMLERVLRGEGEAAGSGHVLVFPANDLATSEERLQSHGIRVNDRTPSTLYFEDPDGHRVGLSKHRFEEDAS